MSFAVKSVFALCVAMYTFLETDVELTHTLTQDRIIFYRTCNSFAFFSIQRPHPLAWRFAFQESPRRVGSPPTRA